MALRWSAGIWTCRILLTLKISIALAIHSLDPLECRREEESCSIDIALRWSENQTTKERFFKTCHGAKNECYLLNELFR